MAPKGKGFMIWKVPSCEGGNAVQIASVAKSAALSFVLIKIADGPYTYNVDKTTKKDLVAPVVAELRARGIQAWGWHYVYGYNPVGEAQMAARRVNELGLDGYVIDAEGEYKLPGRDVAARTFMTELRKGIGNKEVALCSYRFPTYHPEFPWKAFMEKCNLHMPQVYWQGAHNPGDQLRRCVREFQAMSPSLPILPVGPVYRYGGWEPTQSDMLEYLETCITLKLPATSFFAWDYKNTLRVLWDTIAVYPWATPGTQKQIPELLIDALNTRDPAKVIQLYKSDAVHITATETIQGTAALQNWFNTLLKTTLPNGSFRLVGMSGTGNTRHFTWTATSSKGKVTNGNDTLGILDGKIVYHYSYYTVTP